ncbi:MAG: 30S ribosomal protein S4e [Candidatus Woesearchaeota archaeon]|nr:MAG: 30S ribosomal protein S4e [Candidatus Woesearchaeota archaeon]
MKRHLKRINAQKTWKIQRRGIKFITRSNPGGMSKYFTMPVSNLLKYELKLASTTKEVKYIITNGDILINHKKITDYKYPVCFTDIISLPKTKEHYRMIITTLGILKPIPITEAESKIKILKIIGKSYVKGRMQLNLMNGLNLFFEKQHYKVGDSLIVTVPDNIVKEHLPLEKGALVLLYKGKHVGKTGILQEIKEKSVIVKTNEDVYETKKDYVLVVGKDKPEIKMTI